MRVIEELPLLKMSTNISGHPRIYRGIKYCICNLHYLTIFCNLEVYLAIPKYQLALLNIGKYLTISENIDNIL